MNFQNRVQLKYRIVYINSQLIEWISKVIITPLFSDIQQLILVDQIYKYVRIHMEKILQHIKLCSKFHNLLIQYTQKIMSQQKRNWKIIRELNQSIKNYKKQQIIFNKKKISQLVHYLRLMKYSFTNIVLRNNDVNIRIQCKIQGVLNLFKKVLNKLFDSLTQKYSKTKEKLQLFISILNKKQ
ncbi:unnamed protein product [Paramecium sonneborni]|uniref:Uncharacterized protein n=1 Tax=Paramecium sonneborni TaxID=65129 RepID=A0A8S1RVX6_9CILI|nr:unnamed protein product [Paramecium sonneborni]